MDTKKKKPFSPLSYTRVRVFIFFYPETECYHNKILFNNIIVLRKQMLIFIYGRIELITAVRSYTVLTLRMLYLYSVVFVCHSLI